MDSGKDTLYARWLSGDLTEKEREQLLGTEELTELESIIQVSDQLTLPKYDAAAAYEQLKKKQPPKTAKIYSLNARWWMGIAAGVALLVAAITFLTNNSTQEMMAPYASNTKHSLPDQSEIILNDGSKITYEKGKWAKERIVQLTGEAFFSVQKGNTFTVKTANGMVEVLGTQFNVRSWGDKLYVECYEGKVKVNSHSQEAILSPNQAVNIVQGTMQSKQSITHQQPIWTRGISRFNNENINEVFAELERQYNIKVEAPSMNRTFSGAFSHSDLDRALMDICKPMQLTHSIEENGTFVIIQ